MQTDERHTGLRSALWAVLLAICLPSCVVPLPHTSVAVPELSGVVVDARTSKPVSGVTVSFFDHPELSTTTDAKGLFHFRQELNFHLWLGPDTSGPAGMPTSHPIGRSFSSDLAFTHPAYRKRVIDCRDSCGVYSSRPGEGEKGTGKTGTLPVVSRVCLFRTSDPACTLEATTGGRGVEYYLWHSRREIEIASGERVSVPGLLVNRFEVLKDDKGKPKAIAFELR